MGAPDLYLGCIDTIAAGQSLGANGIQANGMALVGILVPAGWTAAAMTFQASVDGVNWASCYDNTGAEVNIVANAGTYVALPPSLLAAVAWLKVRSGTTASPVNQGSNVTLTFVTKVYR